MRLWLIMLLFPVLLFADTVGSGVPSHPVTIAGDVDGNVGIPALDPSFNAIITVDNAHHEIHEGDHFTYTYIDTDFDIADVVEILITTPNTTKWAHLIGSVSSTHNATVYLYEGATHTAGGALTAYNNNRNSATTNTTILSAHNDDGANGTAIHSASFGISSGGPTSSGGEARADTEWVLKQNTKYLLVITSGSDNANMSLRLSWYEHTDAN